jgi:hypothetical protein
MIQSKILFIYAIIALLHKSFPTVIFAPRAGVVSATPSPAPIVKISNN